MLTEIPPMTHSEKTKRIAKVCKGYNNLVAKMTTKKHKTKAMWIELDTYLERECKKEELNYEVMKKILLIN